MTLLKGGNRTTNQVEDSTTPPRISHRKAHRPRHAGIRQQLALLILLLLIPLLALQVFNAYNQYLLQRVTVQEASAETARSVGQTFTAFVNDQHNNNRALSFYFNGTVRLEEAQLNSILTQYRQDNQLLHSYRYAGLDGMVKYADSPKLIGQDVSQETFFKKLLNGADFSLSDLRRSLVDGQLPIFLVSSQVRDSGGRPVGVLMVGVDTTRLGQVLTVQIGARGNISLLDSQGISVYNSIVPEESFERRLQRATPRQPFIEAALAGRDYLTDSFVSRIDGIERTGASVPVPAFGWVTSVYQPVSDAMQPALDQINRNLFLFLIVAALTLLVAILYSRSLARPLLELSSTATAFGQGELDRRARPDYRTTQLRQLALSFNRMAEQIAQETRSKDNFLAQASHELKTPITSIKGFIQLLKKRQRKELQQLMTGPDPLPADQIANRQAQLKMLENVEHQCNRMISLINRILDLSRSHFNQMKFELERLDFRPVLEVCLDAARQLTTPEIHTIVFTDRTDPVRQPELLILADRLRIEQVLMNLLENSIKYSPRGGNISLSLECREPGEPLPETSLVLTIKDQGLGLDPQEVTRIFDRYYRTSTNDRNISGLGLGLYLSYEIIEQHRGRLWASSDGAGQGSSFYLALPLLESTFQTQVQTQVQTPDLPGQVEKTVGKHVDKSH